MDNRLFAAAIIGGGALLILPQLSKASVVPDSPWDVTPKQSTIPGSTLPQVDVVELTDIPGTNWKLPLILTVERDVKFGLFDWLLAGASSLWSAGGTVLSTAGNYLGTALSGTGSFITGTVVPAVIDVTGTTASIIKDIGSTAWDATKVVAGAVGGVASKAWDITSGAVTGSATWVIENADKIKDAAKVATAVAGTVYTIKQMDQSTLTTNPQNVPSQAGISTEQPGVAPQSVTIGYLSSTSFAVNGMSALRVTKMYHPQYKDTMVVTSDAAISAAQGVGYQVVEQMGFASPVPFRYCVPMISLFNPTTADHIVITNPDGVTQLESIGYKNDGYIGYCKALQV